MTEDKGSLDGPQSELERLRDEVTDWEKSFDMYWKAQQRGITKWRLKNPGNELVLPDTGDLMEFVLGEWQKAELEIAGLRLVIASQKV
jgi:hypothetical protein